MSNVVKNVFGIPSGPGGEGPDEGEHEYRPADLIREGEARRLEVRLSNGKRYAPHYSTLLNVLDFGPHAPSERQGEVLGMLFSIGEIWLDGRNLHLPLPRANGEDMTLPTPTLFEALRDERVRVLYVYDPASHEEPPEGTPVILTISYEGRLQEAPAQPEAAPDSTKATSLNTT